MVTENTHGRKQACQRAGGPSPVALALVGTVWVISLIWARGGFAYENSVNAQNQQNILSQAATTQGVSDMATAGSAGIVGPR